MLDEVRKREEIAKKIEQDRRKLAKWIEARAKKLQTYDETGASYAAHVLNVMASELVHGTDDLPSIDPWGDK